MRVKDQSRHRVLNLITCKIGKHKCCADHREMLRVVCELRVGQRIPKRLTQCDIRRKLFGDIVHKMDERSISASTILHDVLQEDVGICSAWCAE